LEVVLDYLERKKEKKLVNLINLVRDFILSSVFVGYVQFYAALHGIFELSFKEAFYYLI
tara:strand:- start:1005 stop:1181 length:177 start_codon:yes stop_codon:yes gene_type:complete